jgi:hypothetical protein
MHQTQEGCCVYTEGEIQPQFTELAVGNRRINGRRTSMEFSDIISPAEQKALDIAAANVEKAKDAVARAYIHQAAEENAATRAEVEVANEELEVACAKEDAILNSFKPRLVALARNALGLPRS